MKVRSSNLAVNEWERGVGHDRECCGDVREYERVPNVAEQEK